MMRNDDRLLQGVSALLGYRGQPRLNLAQCEIVVRFVQEQGSAALGGIGR